MKKILITGSSGFIGKELLKEINKEQNEITITGRDIIKLEKLKKTYGLVNIVAGDLSNVNEANDILVNSFDEIYHLAGYKFVNFSEINVLESINSNLITTMNILQYLKENSPEASFNVVSSDKTNNVKGVYSATKFLNDALVKEHKKYLREIVNLKLSNIFKSPGSIGEIWKYQIINNETINVSNPNATRFFSTIDNVVASLLNNDVKLQMKSLEINDLIEATIIKYNKNYDRSKIILTGLNQHENLHEFNERLDSSSENYLKYSVDELVKII